MNDYKNFCEYVIRPVPNAKNLLLRFLFLTLYTVLTGTYLFVFWALMRVWQPLLLLPFIMYAVIVLTWRYVKVEYEFAIEAGELSVSKIFDGRSRRSVLKVTISDMTLITSATDASRRLLNSPDITAVYDFSEATGKEGSLIAVFPDKKNARKRALVFEANDEMKRILRLCNPSAFSFH